MDNQPIKNNTLISIPSLSVSIFCARVCLITTILLIFMISPSALHASDKSLLIVINSKQSLHHLFVAQLKTQLIDVKNTRCEIEAIDIDDWKPEISHHHSLTLSLGNRAANIISQRKLNQPVLYSLLPSLAYKKLVLSRKNCEDTQCSAVFIDQPLKRTLQLTKLSLPNLKVAGILSGRHHNNDMKNLKYFSKNLDIIIEHEKLMNADNLVSTLGEVLKISDALLSLPDPGIYSSRTVQNILLTAYRYRKPVIGYSKAFVKAGALFAVYSTPFQLSQQTAEVINVFFKSQDNRLPSPQYPRHFTVSVNSMVARSLNINIETEDKLQEKLEAIQNEEL